MKTAPHGTNVMQNRTVGFSQRKQTMQLNNKGVTAEVSQKGNQKLILLDPNARVSH